MISVFPRTARNPADLEGVGYPIIDRWCQSAVLYGQLNGAYHAKVVIPHRAEGIKRDLIPQELSVLKLPVVDGEDDYFRIRNFKSNLKETVLLAEHISYDLLDNLIEDIYLVDKDGTAAIERISSSTVYPHPFRMTSDISNRANIRLVRVNPIQALVGNSDNTVVNRLGGELGRKQFTISMNERLGVNRTSVIR